MRFVVALSLLVAACGEKPSQPASAAPSSAEPATPPQPATPGDEVLARMDEFKVKVCACKNPSCLELVDNEMSTWAMKNMQTLKDLKPTPAQAARADKIDTEMSTCREAVTTASKAPPSTVADLPERAAQPPRP